MALKRWAAILYASAAAVVVVFQLLLAGGAPLGEYAMGGAYPGRFPPALRVVAVIQAALIVVTALVVLSRGGLILRSWSAVSRKLVWGVVAFCALSFILNLITPSAGERRIWAPIAFVLLASSTFVVLFRRQP